MSEPGLSENRALIQRNVSCYILMLQQDRPLEAYEFVSLLNYDVKLP